MSAFIAKIKNAYTYCSNDCKLIYQGIDNNRRAVGNAIIIGAVAKFAFETVLVATAPPAIIGVAAMHMIIATINAVGFCGLAAYITCKK